MRNRAAQGFTLIEVLVTLSILSVMLGLVSFSISGTDSRIVHQETDRMAMLIKATQEEAILKNRTIALVFGSSSYSFAVAQEDGTWQPISKDDVFHDRKIPEGLVFQSIEIDGQRLDQDPRLLFTPSGDSPHFLIILARGKAQWRLEGNSDGTIRTEGLGV